MASVTEELKSQLAQLPAKDRAELAQYPIHFLDETVDPGVEEARHAELLRRVEEIDGNSVVGEPAEAVFARLRERHS